MFRQNRPPHLSLADRRRHDLHHARRPGWRRVVVGDEQERRRSIFCEIAFHLAFTQARLPYLQEFDLGCRNDPDSLGQALDGQSDVPFKTLFLVSDDREFIDLAGYQIQAVLFDVNRAHMRDLRPEQDAVGEAVVAALRREVANLESKPAVAPKVEDGLRAQHLHDESAVGVDHRVDVGEDFDARLVHHSQIRNEVRRSGIGSLDFNGDTVSSFRIEPHAVDISGALHRPLDESGQHDVNGLRVRRSGVGIGNSDLSSGLSLGPACRA